MAVDKSKELLAEILIENDCWHHGPEIPEQISAKLNVNLDTANNIIKLFHEPAPFPLAIDTLKKCEKPLYYLQGAQSVLDQNGKMILDIRGWGWIQKLDNAEQRQDQIGELITEFLNEI